MGVTASPAEVRAAFRRRAREVHPDRQHASSGAGATGDGASESAMRQLNEAWGVLGDAGRRRAYDQALRQEATSGARPTVSYHSVHPDDVPYVHAPAEPGDLGVALARALPWLAFVVVLGAIFVFTAFAAGSGDEEVSASSLVGECIKSERGGVVSKVPCTEANDGRVDLVTVRASLCPDGSSAVRLPTQQSWLCLRQVGP